MFEIDWDSPELCLIDSGITSLCDVPLRAHVRDLNLHGNSIKHIENLNHLNALRHLDLSSNQIDCISGLNGLHSLRTLNLSCNILTEVRGLTGLRSLVRCNLSYNQIEDLSGFRTLSGAEYKLTQIDLHGNNIPSTDHIIGCLQRCSNLRKLSLQQDGSSNPCCRERDYRETLLKGLPQIQTLDNMDRSGYQARPADILADIPGLEDYMDFLVSSGNSMDYSSAKILNLATPKIDEALEKFKKKTLNTDLTESSASVPTESELEVTTDSRWSQREHSALPNIHDERLKVLEDQLASLMKSAQAANRPHSPANVSLSPRRPRNRASGAKNDFTDDSDDQRKAYSKDGSQSKRTTLKSKRSKIPSYRKSTQASRARKPSPSPNRDQKSSTLEEDSSGLTSETGAITSHIKQPTAVCIQDSEGRQDIQATYVTLMKELETERERRWKAEQASKKLVTKIQELQVKATDGDKMRDITVEATTRLKQALMNEREARLRAQDDVDSVKEQMKELARQLKIAKETEESLKKSLRNLDEVVAKMEREKLQQQTHEQKKTHDAQMRASALNRESEMLRSSNEKLKNQLQQLQELLASREQQHREEMQKCFTPNSAEMLSHVRQEVSKVEKECETQLKIQQQKVDTLTHQYSELEDEFRIALQIEANRFKEVHVEFEHLTKENAEHRQALQVLQSKDEKSSSMLTELTALVKEQKGRIAELSKSKQEMMFEQKERIQSLEAQVEEARKRMLQMELLKQDKTKLLAQVEAQESVISGLKAERKLWGQELAHQGASLAQDRGRLEAKIETLTAEVSTLKKQLDREADALKIKTKMLEDQTETIRKLKEAVIERDEEIKRLRDESLKIQRNFEEQLAEERAVTQDNQETLERLRERKQELKQQNEDLEAELDESKKAHSVLNNKWKEKSQLIGQLEKQVQEMKESWESKEKKLTLERDKALHAANLAIDKLKTVDDAFRKQLDAKEQKHQQELQDLEQEKQRELDEANMRIFEVEEEMRMLLKENEDSKRAMEDRFKKLNQAMADIQSNLA